MSAILAGDAATVRAVLRAGISAAAADRYGTTPLYHASVQGEAEIAQILLEAGARPNVESGIGRPRHPLCGDGLPLCAAAAHGYLDVARVLLAYGADPNLQEDRGTGFVPLGWAVRHGSTEVADVLRAWGARPPR